MNFNKDEKSSSAQNWNLSRTVISSSPRYFFVSWDDVQGHQIGNPLKEKQKRRRSWSKRETERGRKFFSVYHFCACHFGSKRQSISLQHPLRHLSQGKVVDHKKSKSKKPPTHNPFLFTMTVRVKYIEGGWPNRLNIFRASD